MLMRRTHVLIQRAKRRANLCEWRIARIRSTPAAETALSPGRTAGTTYSKDSRDLLAGKSSSLTEVDEDPTPVCSDLPTPRGYVRFPMHCRQDCSSRAFQLMT